MCSIPGKSTNLKEENVLCSNADSAYVLVHFAVSLDKVTDYLGTYLCGALH